MLWPQKFCFSHDLWGGWYLIALCRLHFFNFAHFSYYLLTVNCRQKARWPYPIHKGQCPWPSDCPREENENLTKKYGCSNHLKIINVIFFINVIVFEDRYHTVWRIKCKSTNWLWKEKIKFGKLVFFKNYVSSDCTLPLSMWLCLVQQWTIANRNYWLR